MELREKQRQALIELREKLVGELHTLPYTIYTDENIEDLLQAQPKSIGELTNVKGFPEAGKRVVGFGEAIVLIFTQTESIEGFELTSKEDGIRLDVNLKKMTVF